MEDDYALFLENGGPGGAYDKFIYGDVITNIDSYHGQLKEHVMKTAEELNANLKDRAMAEQMKHNLEVGGRETMMRSNLSRISNNSS